MRSFLVPGTIVAGSLCVLLTGCECDSPTRPVRDGSIDRPDGSPATDFDAGPGGGSRDAHIGPNPDAFFFDDPPPRICYPDGGMGPWPDPPGGTPECPDDRAREGCRCNRAGDTAPCWPGPRANRHRGTCRDGVATCEPWDEFGGRWGACVGAILPTPGVEIGPQACECFSMGRWQIDNLGPCIISTASGDPVAAVSTFINASGMQQCPNNITDPPTPEPGTHWSTNRLTVDCAGSFRLCYTIKAGSRDNPLPTDCVMAESCVDTYYPQAGVVQELPPLPAWSTTNAACVRAYRDMGGYGEMSVLGLSVECDEIDDGSGQRRVFNRVGYCPARCNTMPDLPECANCGMGGSGGF